jgi:uncharacterized membrane protein
VVSSAGGPAGGRFEDYPLTRIEYITSLVHFYRGERGRADAWRARLDPTTNWAVVTTGGMLSFAFSSPDHSHITLLLANLLVAIFLGFEARRFRYFDVWRSRVRMIEENFFIPIIRRNLVSPREDWREWVAADLDCPKFKITFLEAVAIRLRYNYVWIFLVILFAWLAKIHLHPTPALSPEEAFARLPVGPFSHWVILGPVAAFYGAALSLAVWARTIRGGGDEVHGVEKSMERWKT